jgi:hypothetical protein
VVTITVDIAAVEKRLADMHNKLHELGAHGLGDEFFNWQAEDMHRKHPTLKKLRGKRYRTVIRPHSYFEVMRSRHFQSRLGRRHRPHTLTSTRPILRPALLTRLQERLRGLLDAIKW